MMLKDIIGTSTERMKELASMAEELSLDENIEPEDIVKTMIAECKDTDESFLVGWWMGKSDAKVEMKRAFKSASERGYV